MNQPSMARRWLRAPLIVCAAAASLVACGGGRSSDTPSGSTGGDSVRAAVERLEASGELPVLDRTDSIADIDANANGVRDDIERYIERQYSDPAQRKAAMDHALVYQQMLLVDKRDEAALDAVSALGWKSTVCSTKAFPGSAGATQAYQMSRDIESMTSNTNARLKAYIAYNKARSGSASTTPKEEICD